MLLNGNSKIGKFGKSDIDLFVSRINRQRLDIQNQKPWQLMPSVLLGIATIFTCYHLLVL